MIALNLFLGLSRFLAMNPMSVRRAAALCAVLFVVGLFIGGSQPVAAGLVPAPWDKLAHMAAFSCLSVLLVVAMRPRAIWYPVVWAAAVAVLDELHQLWLPGRQADLSDLVADGAGIGLVCFLLHRMTKSKIVQEQ